ncbi:flavodoxin domain-containing protein [Bacillus sp. MRMR6]|uniref:flavodoxin domain-containing protein n=1 Tax=Bacillus sp. MRMR6 TaxID=1928617 RepID=UPI000952C49A|nr:flavodoxin domain-containing protein [Bacillus sp. MRMR6]OLS40685.1 flavodoxin [Bacillus sp. MRMR6]
MKLAVVYASQSGNTEELAELLFRICLEQGGKASLFSVEDFPHENLTSFDAVMIGTYTWGNGEIPLEMMGLYQAFEKQDAKNVMTGVFGTGDSSYPHFCGAVDHFRDMLFRKSRLAVTLKIELRPQSKDLERCEKFVSILLGAMV